MEIKPDEIASILRQRIEGLDAGQADLSEVGTVLSVADGITRIHGLDNCMALEMLELPHDVTLRATRSSGPDACSRSRSATSCWVGL